MPAACPPHWRVHPADVDRRVGQLRLRLRVRHAERNQSEVAHVGTARLGVAVVPDLDPPAATPTGSVLLRYGLLEGTPATGDMTAG